MDKQETTLLIFKYVELLTKDFFSVSQHNCHQSVIDLKLTGINDVPFYVRFGFKFVTFREDNMIFL